MIKINVLFLHNIFFLLISLISVLNLNIKIVTVKIKTKKKIIFLYHPEKKLTSISTHYLNFFFKDDDKFKILNGHVSFGNKKLNNSYFYINQRFLKFIFGIDFFIASYVNNEFPKKCEKIYLHHDIYDTPLVDQSKERQILSSISKYDYIFVASEKIKIEFYKRFRILLPQIIIPKIFITGYLKLEYLYFKKKKHKMIKNKNIVIAPTNFMAFSKFNLISKLEKIILILLNKTKYNVLLRLHPSNINFDLSKKIAIRFNNNKRFFFDNSSDYFNTYINSICMITDMSGTAYTYAFMTKNPIIFFSRNEGKLLKESNYQDLDYFKNRKKIGIIANNANQIPNKIYKILNNKKIKKNIQTLCKDVYDQKNTPYNKIIKIMSEIGKKNNF